MYHTAVKIFHYSIENYPCKSNPFDYNILLLSFPSHGRLLDLFKEAKASNYFVCEFNFDQKKKKDTSIEQNRMEHGNNFVKIKTQLTSSGCLSKLKLLKYSKRNKTHRIFLIKSSVWIKRFFFLPFLY